MRRDKQLEVSGTRYPSEKTTAWARNPHRWVSAPILGGGGGESRLMRAKTPVPVCVVVGAGRGLSYIRGWTGSEIEAQAKHSRVRKT